CETLTKVDTNLPPTRHKPKIRPENKGIKPNTNRHRPKIISLVSAHRVSPQGPFHLLPSVKNSVHSVHSVKTLLCGFFRPQRPFCKTNPIYPHATHADKNPITRHNDW